MSKNQFRQQKKYIETLAKKNRYSEEYIGGNYPKPLTRNVRYKIDHGRRVFVVIIKEISKSRHDRNYVYKAEVEEFINPGEENYWYWNNYGAPGFDFNQEPVDEGLTRITHSSYNDFKVSRLSDSGYAKLFLVMDAVDETEIY